MAAKPSKFSTIFDAPQPPEPAETPALPPANVTEPDDALESVTAVATPAMQEQAAPQPTGRATNGKKSDPRYKQVTAYVRKDLHRNVTDALYDEARGRDTKRKEFSELVDELLERWWQERNGRNGKAS